MGEDMIELALVTPEKEPVALEVEEVIVPGAGGVFSVYPGHTPFLTTLASGVLIAFESESSLKYFAVHGGFAEVNGDKVTVLADCFEAAEDIDEARAAAAREGAEERLRKRGGGENMDDDEGALARSVSRLQAHAREGY